ncbi:MAG: HDOD domain-containing protein, partial [Dehalococcoidia bacterium]
LDPQHEEAQRFRDFAVAASAAGPTLLSATGGTPAVEATGSAGAMSVEAALEEIAGLVPLPLVATRVIEAANNEAVTMDELARLIGTDPALTTRLLSVANSAFYGGRMKRVATIKEAITLLGIREIRSMALGVCMVQAIPPGRVVSQQDFWRFSLAVATLADLLARSAGSLRGDAFSAGIVHNIGLMALDLYRPEALRRAIELRGPLLRRLHDREQQVFGFTDAELGAALARRWGLPEPIVEVIETHGFRPDEVPATSELARQVIGARIYVRSQGLSDGVEQSEAGLPPVEWNSGPLAVTMERIGGLDGILRRTDEFLRLAPGTATGEGPAQRVA